MQCRLLSLIDSLQEENSFKSIVADIKSQITATPVSNVPEEQYQPKQAYDDGPDALVSSRIAGLRDCSDFDLL